MKISKIQTISSHPFIVIIKLSKLNKITWIGKKLRSKKPINLGKYYLLLIDLLSFFFLINLLKFFWFFGFVWIQIILLKTKN